MNFFRLIISFPVLVFLFTIETSAQNNFEPGYYITNDGDSITGLIRVSKYTNKTQIIEFLKNENSIQHALNPTEIKIVCITDVRRFTSEYYPGQGKDPMEEKLFFEEIVQGVISLYYFPDIDNKNHIFIKKNDELIHISNNSVEIQPDLHKYEIDNIFRRSLIYYLNDCDKIQPAIQSTTYTVKSMARLMKKYHECLGLDYNIESEKDIKDKISFGISTFVNQSNLSYSYPTQVDGSHVDITMNSNLYFSFGMFLKMSSNKVSPRIAVSLEPSMYQLVYTDEENSENKSQKYLNLQFPLIISYDLMGKSKNKVPLEIGVSYTPTLNNPQGPSTENPILHASVDIIGGLGYNISFPNEKNLGLCIRYNYGISNINPPFNYGGKRHRIGLGISYELLTK